MLFTLSRKPTIEAVAPAMMYHSSVPGSLNTHGSLKVVGGSSALPVAVDSSGLPIGSDHGPFGESAVNNSNQWLDDWSMSMVI